MLLVFAITLFTSATLLFMVEPMIGKMITPLLGGTPAVWNTCMVFYQAVLLAGYAYAHFSTSWLGARKQAALHVVLLALPFLFLPVAVNPDLIKGGENPILGLLRLLSMTVGLPMFVVSASAPLLQRWFADTSHPSAQDPYFLYGASNLGSMLALLAYPTVVEPNLRLGQQSIDWTIGYGVLAALTVLCALFLWRSPARDEGQQARDAKEDLSVRTLGSSSLASAEILKGDVTWLRVLRWVALAFVPSSLMLGATTYITTDIAAIPLLWVTPLALYLLSFIIVFSHVPSWLQWLILVIEGVVIGVVAGFLLWDVFAARPLFQLVVRTLIVLGVGAGVYVAWWGWKYRSTDMLHRAKVLVMPLLVLGVLFFMLFEGKVLPIGGRLALHLAMLFVVSMVCHGELARDRPAAKYLTGYFLWMSVGGVLGGLFNGLLAPVIFTGIVEYELVMVLACYLAPPLGPENESSWGRSFDMILALMFASLGLLLIVLRLRDKDLPFAYLKDSPWPWELAALIVGIVLCSAAALRARENKPDRWLDLILPLCLGVLLIGLAWGLRSNALWPRVTKIAVSINQPTSYLIGMLVYGVPIVLCYVFVERSVRFALGVGMVLLASAFCSIFDDRVVHQERSLDRKS